MSKKILILSTGDTNGAYEAAYRIAKFSIDGGHKVILLVEKKTKTDKFVVEMVKHKLKNIGLIGRLIKQVVVRFFNLIKNKKSNSPSTNPKYLFLNEDETKMVYPTKLIIESIPFTPDLVIVGMVNGFLNTTNLAELYNLTNARIALVTVDMYPLTGGCHYAWDCVGYENDCSNCPAIRDKNHLWWPKENLAIKRENIIKAGIDVISMSGWSNIQIQKSSLFKGKADILQINSCIDMAVFNNSGRSYAKSVFNINKDSKVIFIGSQNLTDERKGVNWIIKALEELFKTVNENITKNIVVVLIGRDVESVTDIGNLILFEKHFIEYINDYRLLSLLYQAADVFVCGSVEDTGPMMVSEALACGTPVVGFDTGIIYNIVENGKNGFKVPIRDWQNMALGIKKIIELEDREFMKMSEYGTQKIKSESSKEVVINVVNKLLS